MILLFSLNMALGISKISNDNYTHLILLEKIDGISNMKMKIKYRAKFKKPE